MAFAGTGMGKISPRGDGDGGSIPDGEFPIAILKCDTVQFVLLLYIRRIISSHMGTCFHVHCVCLTSDMVSMVHTRQRGMHVVATACRFYRSKRSVCVACTALPSVWTGCTSWWEKDGVCFILTHGSLGWELKKRPALLKVTLLWSNRQAHQDLKKKDGRHFLLSEMPGITNYLEMFKGHIVSRCGQ